MERPLVVCIDNDALPLINYALSNSGGADLWSHADDGAHDTRRRDLPDVIRSIGNVNVAVAVGGNTGREAKARGATNAVSVARQVGAAGERRHDTDRCDLADDVIIPIGNVDVTGAVGGNPERNLKARIRSGAVDTARYTGATGERRYDTGRRDLADGVIVAVSDVNIAEAVGRNAGRIVKARGCTGVADTTPAPHVTGKERERHAVAAALTATAGIHERDDKRQRRPEK